MSALTASFSLSPTSRIYIPRQEKGDGSKGPATPSGKEGSFNNVSTISAEERIIPTNKEGVTAAPATQRTQEIHSSSSYCRKGSSSRIIPLKFEDDTESNDTPTPPSTSASTTSQSSEMTGSFERVIPTIREGDVSANGQRRTSTQYSSFQSRVLPIKRRGRFFQDSTFERVWDDFENAVDDLVTKKGSEAEEDKKDDDQIQSYRNLRKVIKEEDNQAATVTKEEDGYKIVMDVKDFADAVLDVKALEGSIVVKGQKGTNSFERRFSIPGLSEPEKVAAALSADGVLTITAPL